MKRIITRLRAPKGLALALFVAIVVVAVAQISWWILFQITISREQEQLYMKVSQNYATLAAATLNYSYDWFISDVSPLAWNGNPRQVKETFDELLSHPAVRGYIVYDSAGRAAAQGGEIDSALYYPIKSRTRVTLFLNEKYPQQLIGQLNRDLVYHGDGERCVFTPHQFTADMFTLKPEVLAQVKNKAFHRIVMFVAEGSFFVLLTLFGAFMIYRTLRQSEELKLQQENFIHAVSHEFKIPVASIKLYLETMASQKIDKDKCLSLVPRMLDDCRRLELLVDNVLEAGRLTRQSHHLKLSPANLSADLAEYFEELHPLAERNRLKLTTDIEPDICIRSDYQAMRRVISALVDNAIKYSPETRRELTITAKRVGNQCQLVFADRGVGIEPHERSRIFDRFYRTGMESTRSVKGTGLGLFLVKEIVAEHGGSVEVNSDGLDCGSTFVITLPLEMQA
jgi:two-component system, OmpR family, sensor histidine kinase CiaH